MDAVQGFPWKNTAMHVLMCFSERKAEGWLCSSCASVARGVRHTPGYQPPQRSGRKNVGGRHLKALSKQIRTNEPPLTWAVCVTIGHGDPGPGVLILDFQKQGPLTGRPMSHLPRECKSNHSVNGPILDNQFCGPVFCNMVCRDHHGP